MTQQIQGVMTTGELAAQLGKPKRAIYRDVKKGRINPHRLQVHEGVSNAPFYFTYDEVKRYKKLYTLVPASSH